MTSPHWAYIIKNYYMAKNDSSFSEERKPMGRPPGTPNKVNLSIKNAISAVFHKLQEVDPETGESGEYSLRRPQ